MNDAIPIVCLNGAFVPAAEAVVPVFDRGFQLGDGCFETLRVARSQPVRWSAHWSRFNAVIRFTGIVAPWNQRQLREVISELITRNSLEHGAVRIQLTRGVGRRGYSTLGADRPFWCVSAHPLPPIVPGEPAQTRLVTSEVRIAATDATARWKTASRLVNVLARKTADDAGADDALLLDSRGRVLEATSSNVFWFEGDTMFRPPPDAPRLVGTTERALEKVCAKMRLSLAERWITPAQLRRADGVFLTNCTRLVSEVVELDGAPVRRSERVRDVHRGLARTATP